ncbi:MAG TPA: hypothetical protein DDZ80_02645 [Cyanobacteria bacterium UBA8803]|nr:hypothetical protein [Cyanobacteria bacterium UBA9273]HBL57478.1 hypothetical protein [Cyanobacteria bacterium UBA8803]
MPILRRSLKLQDAAIMQVTSKVPLERVLLVPFAIQMVGMVGVLGYFWERNRQQVLEDLVNRFY